MHKRSFQLGALIFLLAVLIIFLIPTIYRTAGETTAKSIKTATFSSNPPYLLTSFDDHLILIDSEGKTLRISDIDPRTLPPYDQSSLTAGIPIQNFSMLEVVLQDFS